MPFTQSVLASCLVFFFNIAPPSGFHSFSLHDALPIWHNQYPPYYDFDILDYLCCQGSELKGDNRIIGPFRYYLDRRRSEEHTSELQSHSDLVCRLLLEKKKHRQGRGGQSHSHEGRKKP